MDKSMILYRKKTRIVLNPEYIERVKKENQPLQNQADALEPKTIPCRFCGYPAAVKYGGAVGLVQIKCRHCNHFTTWGEDVKTLSTHIPHYQLRYLLFTELCNF